MCAWSCLSTLSTNESQILDTSFAMKSAFHRHNTTIYSARKRLTVASLMWTITRRMKSLFVAKFRVSSILKWLKTKRTSGSMSSTKWNTLRQSWLTFVSGRVKPALTWTTCRRECILAANKSSPISVYWPCIPLRSEPIRTHLNFLRVALAMSNMSTISYPETVLEEHSRQSQI